MTLDDQSGKKRVSSTKDLTEEVATWGAGLRSRRNTWMNFSHKEILAEVSAPLEIVSRLLGTKFVIAITPEGLCACLMQHLSLGISEVPDSLWFSCSLPSYFTWMLLWVRIQSPDLIARFLDGDNKAWKASRNLLEVREAHYDKSVLDGNYKAFMDLLILQKLIES